MCCGVHGWRGEIALLLIFNQPLLTIFIKHYGLVASDGTDLLNYLPCILTSYRSFFDDNMTNFLDFTPSSIAHCDAARPLFFIVLQLFFCLLHSQLAWKLPLLHCEWTNCVANVLFRNMIPVKDVSDHVVSQNTQN